MVLLSMVNSSSICERRLIDFLNASMTYQSSAKLQQENQRLQAELTEMRSRYESLEQLQGRYQQIEVQEKLATERSHLLKATAQVANLLLRTPDCTTVLADVVRILGEAAGSGRCGVLQNTLHQKLKAPATQILVEWCNSSISSSIEATPELEQGFLWDYVSEHRDELAQGKIANLLTTSLRETARSIFEQQGTISMLVVPILVGEKFWGAISFDNCGEPRLYDEAEIAILQVAAESIAAAIARQARDEELQESERRYRTLFELSSEGIMRFAYHQPIPLSLSVDEQLELCYQSVYIAEGNEAFAKMYECEKAEDLMGLTLNDFHDRNSEVTLATMRAYVEAKHSARSTETVEFDRHGRKRYFLNSSVSTIENDCVVSTWVSQVDITELREAQQALLEAEQERVQQLERLNLELQQTLERLAESEKRYRNLFEISGEGIFRWKLEPPISINLPVDEQVELINHYLRVAEVNAAGAVMYGTDNPEDLIGLRLTDIHVGTSEQNQMAMRSLIENGYQIRNAEIEEVDLDSNPRYLLNNIATTIEDGYAFGIWASQLDITELRLAQQALLQAEQERVAELAKTNQALKNSLDRLADEPDLDSFLGHVLTETSQQLQIDLGYLFFYNSGDRTLELHMQITPAGTSLKQELKKTHPFRQIFSVADLPIWDTLLKTQKPFIIDRQNAAQYAFRGIEEWQTRQQEHQAGINILLTIRDEPIGLLTLASTKQDFSPQEIELAQALAQQATLAIQLTRLAEFAKQSAIIEERNQLAREIHDTLGQTLTAIALQLEAGKRLFRAKPKQVASILSCAQDLAHQGIIQVQRSLYFEREG